MHAEPVVPDWVVAKERGTMGMLRLMTLISLRLGRDLSRIVLYGIVAYYFVFAPTPRRHMLKYLRHALQRDPTARDRYHLLLNFASTIHDRIYLLNDEFHLFDVAIEGLDVIEAHINRDQGVLLMGAHMGSFEVIRALGIQRPGLTIAMAMYEDNARKISSMLSAINPQLTPDIISLGNVDSMLQIQSRLNNGACVGVLSDRSISTDSLQKVTFLGETAWLPTGAMRAAAILRRPVIFMAGLYLGTNRYHVVFHELADFTKISVNRADAIRAAIESYAKLLELQCQIDPYNWFNFFDFWREPDHARNITSR